MAALYVNWGQDAARAFLHKLYDNKVQLLGGNAEVAQNVGDGTFMLGLTDSDDVSDAMRSGGKETMTVPDQGRPRHACHADDGRPGEGRHA